LPSADLSEKYQLYLAISDSIAAKQHDECENDEFAQQMLDLASLAH
jgi:hypothetical protein